MRSPCNSSAAQSKLLCQSGQQGANHFRLSGTKSADTEKLSTSQSRDCSLDASGEQRLEQFDSSLADLLLAACFRAAL
jgi:hypothetical protein